MGRKRKANTSAMMGKEFPSAFEDRSGSRIKLTDLDDAMESEDEFLSNREKILLDEGPDRKRLRKAREDEALLDASDEEILGMPTSDEDEEDDEDGTDYVDNYADNDGATMDIDEDMEITGKQKRTEEDEEDGWGTSRKDLYGDDELETEADALAHETEARRIQMRQLESMKDADFEFGEADWLVDPVGGERTELAGNVLEILPEATLADGASSQERLKILDQRYPEFQALRKEFLSLQSEFLQLRMARTDGVQGSTIKSQIDSTLSIKHHALSAYLGLLAMYFALLTSTATNDKKTLSRPPAELRHHDIMDALLTTRMTWMLAKDLKESALAPSVEQSPSASKNIKDELLKAAKAKSKSKVKVKKPSASEIAHKASHERRAARLAAVEQGFTDLDGLEATSLTKKAKVANPVQKELGGDSHLGDETEVNAFEVAEKAAKRKTLKFYTSQITQKVLKRNAKSNEIGGDTDIPHREKWKERQARLNEEAERKQQSSGKRDANDEGGASDSDGYQSLVARAAKHKSDKKKAASNAYAEQEAERLAGAYGGAEEIGLDGKRKINYQIEKNKGLAPHRKKDVRNPRVKKRKKFEEKMKKLGSVKAVYKGGPGKHGYQGELTGIKTNLVKGTKLS